MFYDDLWRILAERDKAVKKIVNKFMLGLAMIFFIKKKNFWELNHDFGSLKILIKNKDDTHYDINIIRIRTF